ncbi:putative protein S-acyltransferase 7, partial [Mucuna pruriens]
MPHLPPPPPPPPPENPDSGAPSLVRTYRVWQGSNVFLFGGRLIFGPDVKSIFISIFLVLVPVAVFCAMVARKLLEDFPHHSGWSIMVAVIALTLFVLITLVVTSGRDPGIVPRNAHPPEPDDYHATDNSKNEQSPLSRLPRTKDVIVNGITVKVKYCDTCMLYRPPRTSHCSVCDNCVQRFDHHCPWVGQCIGLRNYRFYYMFVFSATLLCLYVHAFCWVYIKKIKDSKEISIWKAMTKTIPSIVLIVYTFICVWFVGGLTVFHTYLISTNQSTYENFRYRYDPQDNPHNRGIVKNFKEVFCTRIPPSKNNFRSKVPKEASDSYERTGIRTLSPLMKRTSRNMTVYNERDEEESNYINYRDGIDNEERSRDSELTDKSLDLSRILHTEGEEGQESSLGRQPLQEITPQTEVGESNWAAGPSHSTKAVV